MKFRTCLLLSVAFAGIVAMSSCVKNYTCHCTITYSGTPGLTDTTTEYTIKDTKSGAKGKCTGASGTFDNNYIHTVETCYLY